MRARTAVFAALALAGLKGAPASAAPVELVDIAGRTVTLEAPAERVLLGEGRFLVALSLRDPDRPVERTAGMLDDFRRYDPAGFARYAEAFPGVEAVPVFGRTTEQSVSVEKAIALAPDAAVFGVSGHGPALDSAALTARLEAAGIPVVFIDFRDRPLANTAESMRILGRALGLDARAESFADLHDRAVAAVAERLPGGAGRRPTVFLEARVGLGSGCCFTIAHGMLADPVEAAGGANIASDRLPGAAGMLGLEHVIAVDPEVYIGTAVGSRSGAMHAPGRIALGAGTTATEARASLAAALDRRGISGLGAVRSGRAYGIWRHFYNSPLNACALQRFAKWLHPELFADLDPERLLATMLERMGPVDLDGVYAVGLTDSE